MADDVNEDMENALNTITSTTEWSVNMKKELKHNIYGTVSTLRKLFVKQKDIDDSKTRAITELETLVASTKVNLEGVICRIAKEQQSPSVVPRRELAKPTARGMAPSGAE